MSQKTALKLQSLFFNASAETTAARANPVAMREWRVEEFSDKRLLAIVLGRFKDADYSPEDFQVALLAAREFVYQDARRHLLSAMGMRFAQWRSMRKACELLEIEGFDKFAGPEPNRLLAPADREYTTYFIKAVHDPALALASGLGRLSLSQTRSSAQASSSSAVAVSGDSKSPSKGKGSPAAPKSEQPAAKVEQLAGKKSGLAASRWATPASPKVGQSAGKKSGLAASRWATPASAKGPAQGPLASPAEPKAAGQDKGKGRAE